jgi:putative redox protein
MKIITLNRVNISISIKNERGHLVNVDSRPEYGDDMRAPVRWN